MLAPNYAIKGTSAWTWHSNQKQPASMRRSLILVVRCHFWRIRLFGLFKKKEPPKKPPSQFPPVPDWKPSIVLPLIEIADRVKFYTNTAHDFAIFRNGTAAILPAGLSDTEAELFAKQSLHQVFHAHPDMHPLQMDDGNILVKYKSNVISVVLSNITDAHWSEINNRHQDALATSEVLITPLGHNVFDDFGKKALFGRCFMFMDAQQPEVVRIVRHDI